MDKQEKRKEKVAKAVKDKKIIDDTSFTVFQMIEDLREDVEEKLNELVDDFQKEQSIDSKAEKIAIKLATKLAVLEKGNDGENGLDGRNGKDGNDGENYILTNQDKYEIAKSIVVPIIEKETILEKTEVIHETPIVTENVVEKAVTDEPNVIAEKLNTLKEIIEPDVIKGYRELEKLFRLSVFNPTMGPSFADLANINKRISDISTGMGAISIGDSITNGIVGSVLFVDSNKKLAQDNPNFYLQDNAITPTTLATNTNVAFSVNTGGDFSGTDAINLYGQYDAYLSNSLITNSLTGLNTDGAVPGYTTSSSRGTGASPIQLATGDLVGGYFGFGAQGVSPAYQNLGGMSVYTTGSSTNNLGGELRWYTKGDGGSLTQWLSLQNNGSFVGTNRYTKFGSATPNNTTLSAGTGVGLELWGTDNTINGVQIGSGNTSNGISAYTGYFLNNDLASDGLTDHFAGIFLNSSGYTDTTFGTAFAIANLLTIQNTDGPISLIASKASAQYVNVLVGGIATTNEILRVNTGGLVIGSTTSVGKFTLTSNALGGSAGADSTGVYLQNTTAAAAGAQQVSPALIFSGNGWATNSGGSTQNTSARIMLLPIQGTSSPAGNLQFQASLNGGAYSTGLTLTSGGTLISTPSSAAAMAYQTSSTNTNSNFVVTSTGLASNTISQLIYGGATTTNYRIYMRGNSSTVATVNASTASFIMGTMDITTAASGTHAWVSGLVLKAPTITIGTATVTNAATLYIEAAPTGATNNYALIIAAGSTYLGGKVSGYNNVATTGWGIPSIYGTGRTVGAIAAVASVATYTVGAADGSFLVSANVLVTTATVHAFTVTVAYTDEGNTARVLTLQFSSLAGAFVTSIANAAGAVPYEGVPLQIRCKAATAITIASAAGGTYTTVVYNIEGSITQIS